MRKILLVFGVISLLLTYICTPYTSTIQAQERNISWECPLYCNETSGKIDYVVFGEAPDANDGLPADDYDVAKPPAPVTPYVRAYLKDNLPSPYNSLWKDYRRYPDSSKVWNLTVIWAPEDDESPTDIIITWNPTKVDASEYTTVHLCTNTGFVLKNMLIDNSYMFSCPAIIPQNFRIICTRNNTLPRAPSIPTGETTGYHGTAYTYSTSSTDPDGDDLYYQFDWGNNIISSWLGPYKSGVIISTSYAWPIPGNYSVKAHVKDIYGDQSNWSSALLVDMMNRAPSQPTNPSPQNRTSNVQTSPILTWTGTDPDGDLVTYTVYFGTPNPPVKLVDNQSSSSFHPETLQYQTIYYWRIISWDGFGGSVSSPVWSFTTQATDGGSSEPPNGDTNQTNHPPVADASLSEQTGFVSTLLIFNGSRSYDPDGYLTKWFWEFGDGTNGSGERTIHTYQMLGTYTVTLTVTDDTGATGTDTITVEVGSANWPPIKPMINGTRTGTKNTTYTYTLYATDADNDFLQYIVRWGDGTQNTSMFLPNGTIWSLSHSWSTAGKYQIIAQATDNTTYSEQTTREVFIDVSFINSLGFLFDTNNDGQFDSFYINDTGIITGVQRLTNGSYLLDTDNDGKWNYQYDPSTGSLTPFSTTITTIENQWLFVLIISVAVIIIACIVYLYKKNYF
jgi:PKD repeat protein